MKNNLLSFILLLASFLSITACEKQQYELVDAEETKLAGNYTVQMYRETLYDSMGVYLSKTENTNSGSLELKMNTNNGSDVFSHFIFKGDIRNTFIPASLRRGAYNCGYEDPVNKAFHVYYQCDPDKKRILLAAICAGITNTYYLDYTFKGNEFKLYARIVDRISKKQTFIEIIALK